jgi:hypothetical protein
MRNRSGAFLQRCPFRVDGVEKGLVIFGEQ